MTGEGDVANLALDAYSATAGTSLGVIAGGASGLLTLVATNIAIDPDTSAADPSVIPVPPAVIPGWLRSPNGSSQQELELNYGTLLFFEEGTGGYPRDIILRMILKRAMP
jgi:hypothetical protein